MIWVIDMGLQENNKNSRLVTVNGVKLSCEKFKKLIVGKSLVHIALLVYIRFFNARFNTNKLCNIIVI